jgi:hypothetical protein
LSPPESTSARVLSPVVAQVVEETGDGDDIGPRVVGRAGCLLPEDGEPLGGSSAEGQQVHAAVRDIGHGRAGARARPVDHSGHGAAPPQDVAWVEVSVHW